MLRQHRRRQSSRKRRFQCDFHVGLQPDLSWLQRPLHLVSRKLHQLPGHRCPIAPVAISAKMCRSARSYAFSRRRGRRLATCVREQNVTSWRPGTESCGDLSQLLASEPYPTISLPAKNWAISSAAFSGESEPCAEFSPIDSANSLRIVPAVALAGLVAPITSR